MSKKLQVGAILIITFLLFLPSARYGLVSDDHLLIEINPRITAWSYVPGYFTTHLVAHLPGQMTPYYRPLYLLWLRLNFVALGPVSPIWHLASVLLHVLVTAGVFALARKLTGDFRASLLAAALFGIHPIHTEAVCWISDAQDLLVTVLLLFSVYLFAIKKGAISFASVLLATLAMFTKEPGILAPALIFIYAWSRTNWKESLAASVPYLPPALLYLLMRRQALGPFAGGGPATMSISDMVYTWPDVLFLYAKNLLWPFHLSMSYAVHTIRSVWPLLLVAACVGLLVWYLRNSSANVRFAALWAGLTLLPALAIRYLLAGEYVHDRYLYLPTVGLALLAAELLRRVNLTPPRTVAVGLVAVLLCGVTASECRIWRDDETLYKRSIEVAPNNTLPLVNLAGMYLRTHRDAEALPLLQRAIAIDPNDSDAYLNLARYYDQRGDYDNARNYYNLYVSHLARTPQ